MVNRFDSLAAIQEYSGPVLISHGDADRLIPLEQGRRLYEAAHGPKKLVVIPGGRHNDGFTEEFHAAFERLLYAL
jgi:fermentation-respiration switch protein FrsA (DUF1100 family)